MGGCELLPLLVAYSSIFLAAHGPLKIDIRMILEKLVMNGCRRNVLNAAQIDWSPSSIIDDFARDAIPRVINGNRIREA